MPAQPTILIVDDEKNIRTSLSRSLDIEGYRTITAATLAEARRALGDETVDGMLLDVRLPDGDGLDLLVEVHAESPGLPIVVMSGHGTIDMALEAIRRGAHDFLEKPLGSDKLLVTLHNALAFAGQREELEALRARVASDSALIGSSAAMAELRETIAMAAPTKGRVLITGESGTGKELIAAALHEQSRRAEGPYVKLNCAAIPTDLIESELFGHERGAFTGAHKARKGKFELADGGTLFLDEIGDMRLDVQAKLLRALQEGEIERVGGSRTLKVDVRVVAATHKDLEAAIDDGEFREDLYYRLNVLPLAAPPLRAHLEDLDELAPAFVARACRDHGTRPKRLTPDALEVLRSHDWPGNVRELLNTCERLVILTPSEGIDGAAVRRLLGAPRGAGTGALYRPGSSLKELVHECERQIVQAALSHHSGHMTRTAESLGLERSHLYKKVRALGLRPSDGER